MPNNWKDGGYLERLPKDPWGNPYQYLNPGAHSAIDVFSYGAGWQTGRRGTMRTSARGSDGVRIVSRRMRHTRVARRTSTGFTLLEMLVVLVIVGLLVAVVTLAPSRNRRTDLAEEAQRREPARIGRRRSAGAVDPDRLADGRRRLSLRTAHRKRRVGADDRRPVSRTPLGAEVTGVSVRYTGGGEVPSRVVLGSEGIDVPVTITLWSGDVRMAVVGTGIGNFVVRRP